MDMIIHHEVEYFLLCVIYGSIVSFYYDVIRILRRLIKHKSIFVTIEDVVYGIFIGIRIFLLNYENNSGVVRIFMFVGLFIGGIIYHKIFSTTLVLVSSGVIAFVVDKSTKMLIVFQNFPKNVNKNRKVMKKIRKN